MQNYNRRQIVLQNGIGSTVFDKSGKQYIDCVSGIAVNNVGHCNPFVVDAIKTQAEQLIHVSNLYYTEIQANLAEKLTEISKLERVFFCNSGTEAIEASMKLARITTKKKNFIAAKNSFHGRTMGALSVTHTEKYRTPFEPLIQKVSFVPYNLSNSIKKSITNDTAAVILEPLQGEGGINIPSKDYLKEVREICDDTDTLLILDEVQTGFGRTGKWFCKEHSKIEPDIMVMAKAIGGGFPMGAIASKEGISFDKGEHASTFGGNPLGCAAAIGSIKAIKEENLIQKSKEMGLYFKNKLNAISNDIIIEVRGIGLMIGITINSKYKCADIISHAERQGVLLNCISESVIRIAPPLVITKKEIDEVVNVIENV
ncbi:MAG: aspartate aminotransferase family protein [Methanosarcinaceae archaeon]|nr:aspartate aminotransferase family protein [Methanosarcinaceae archaeon]NKQ39315.1 aspartate aminotransferase family protein [Methanosarcinales archaeon]